MFVKTVVEKAFIWEENIINCPLCRCGQRGESSLSSHVSDAGKPGTTTGGGQVVDVVSG
jgi:hypothetical protein